MLRARVDRHRCVGAGNCISIAPTAFDWHEGDFAKADVIDATSVEEEVLLLDPRTWSVANRIDEALAALPPGVARHASAETHACVIELRTDPHRTVREAAAELSQLRASLDDALQETLGLRAAVAGTHPLVTNEQVAVSSGGRYRQINSSMRALTHREPTMAQHVPRAGYQRLLDAADPHPPGFEIGENE